MTSQDNLTRPRPVIDPTGEPVRAPAWRNLYFLKDGRSYCATKSHPSQALAFQIAETIRKEILEDGERALKNGTILTVVINWISPPLEYPYYAFSHHIQIPAKP